MRELDESMDRHLPADVPDKAGELAEYRLHTFRTNILDMPALAAIHARSAAQFVATCLSCDDFHLGEAQQLLAFLKCKSHLFRVEIGNGSSYGADIARDRLIAVRSEFNPNRPFHDRFSGPLTRYLYPRPHLPLTGDADICPPRQWGERISSGNSPAAAESVNTNADSRTTRPAGTDASPTHNFRSAAALSAPVTSHKRCRAASSTLKVSVIRATPW